MAISNNDFLKSKIANFTDFLLVCLHARLDNERFAEGKQRIEELRACDTAHFVLYVTTDICPWKSNLKSYINKMLAENKLTWDDLTAPERVKFERYLQCFIECVEQ